MTRDDHPDVVWFRETGGSGAAPEQVKDPAAAPPLAPRLRAAELRELCVATGADDAGFVDLDRPALEPDRAAILEVLPGAATIVSIVFRLNRHSLRSSLHSVADAEFQQVFAHANRTCRAISTRLGRLGVRAVNLPVGFPFETGRWPGKMWPVSEKVVAEEAGVGRMGWHRTIIHPELGAAVALGTVLVAAELDVYGVPLAVNPCFECKLCVGVCPTGAIATDGHFDFVSCYTHNYRERLGGFQDWVERLARSRGTAAYRELVSDRETVSMWQNLSIGPQTKCDRCVAVCPAGRQTIAEYLSDEKAYRSRVYDRLRDTVETVYVVAGSDAEANVSARFPQKTSKRVGNGLRPNSPSAFLAALPLVFQRGRAEGLAATYHFVFTGAEAREGTVVIREQAVTVTEGLEGTPDLVVTADGEAWIAFLAKEKSLPAMLLSRRLKLKGSPRLMSAFARCFPS